MRETQQRRKGKEKRREVEMWGGDKGRRKRRGRNRKVEAKVCGSLP